ncbi:hypothetical protein [Paeniglutamicibacter sp. NPDC091659]|uniref:hypothetical protein n=1 Tax=Paeniglutamicibacter sp. NPDC091659 TaxID=3364389 RepID=UPI00380453FE
MLEDDDVTTQVRKLVVHSVVKQIDVLLDSTERARALFELVGNQNASSLSQAPTFIEGLEELAATREQLDSSIRQIAVFLTTHMRIPRLEVAKALGISNMTLGRWIKNDLEK